VNTIPLTPTNTIHGMNGNVKASMQTIVGNSLILVCFDMTDNVLSQGQNKFVMTKFSSIDNIYLIAFGNIAFHISMEKDSLHYSRKEEVHQILANNISQYVKVDIMKSFANE